MNIKRAFLAAAAVLLVPSFAMAQTTLRFDTGVDTTNGADVTVHATLTCNTGLGLTEEYDVTTDLNVTPVVTEVILAPDTFCGITFSDLPSGYRVIGIVTDGDAFPVVQPMPRKSLKMNQKILPGTLAKALSGTKQRLSVILSEIPSKTLPVLHSIQ